MPAPRPVSFRVDEELMAWVRRTADRQGCTLSAVVEGALAGLQAFEKAGGKLETLIPQHPSQKGGRGTPRRPAPAKPAKPTWA